MAQTPVAAPYLHADAVSVSYGATRVVERLPLPVARGALVALRRVTR